MLLSENIIVSTPSQWDDIITNIESCRSAFRLHHEFSQKRWQLWALRGVTIYQYIDDWLLVAPSPDLLHHHLSLTISLLENLGIAINFKKSCLEPLQSLQYIEAVLDSTQATAYLPLDRAETIVTMPTHIYNNPSTMVLYLQRLLRNMAAAIAVLPHAHLQIRSLQLWFILNYKPYRDPQNKPLTLPK